MIFRSRKKEDERVRIAVEASSLFVPIGKSFKVSDSKEASRIIREESPEAVVFIPTEAALSSPRAWASALSSAPYLVVIGDGALKPYKAFMSIIDGVIFSPVPRRLSSAFITQDREKAVSLVSAASEDAKDAITIILER